MTPSSEANVSKQHKPSAKRKYAVDDCKFCPMKQVKCMMNPYGLDYPKCISCIEEDNQL